MLPLATVVEVAPASPPTMLSAAYDPQPESAETTINKKRRREDDAQELFNTIDAHIMFLPSKELSRIEKADPDTSTGRVRIWSVHVFV